MLWYFLGAIGIGLLSLVGFWFYVMSNVETPDYAVVEADGAIEIRDYPPLVTAEIERGGARYHAVRTAFSPLAGYIFAKERPGDKIAMTAPVTQSGAQGEWTVGFIMPSGYTLETLPKPAGSTVSLREIPAQRIAAIRFKGVADDDLLAANESTLRAWLDKRGIEGGPATYAYYNDPMTPGFMRRNEVLIEVSP